MVTGITNIKFMSEERLLVNSVDDIFENDVFLCTFSSEYELKYLVEELSGEPKKVFIRASNQKCPLDKWIENQVAINREDIGDLNVYYNNHLHGKERIRNVDLNLASIIQGIYFRENSVFRIKFADSLNRIYEFGLDNKWNSDCKIFYRIAKTNNVDLNSDDKSLIVAFAILMTFGILVSFLVFLFERWYARYKTNKRLNLEALELDSDILNQIQSLAFV